MDNSTHNMSEKLVQYLDAELTGADKELMEERLASDSALQEELNALRQTREAIRLYGLQQQVASIHKEMMEEVTPAVTQMGSRRKLVRYSFAVAASILLVIGSILVFNFYNLSSSKVFSSNYQSYELRTMRDADTQQLSPVEKAYREKDYRKTVEAILPPNRSASIQDNFIAAMAFSELGNSSGAIEHLQLVLEMCKQQKRNEYKQESEYYLALNYIRNKDHDLALEQLRRIKEDPTHLYHQKVTSKLIRQVKMLKWR